MTRSFGLRPHPTHPTRRYDSEFERLARKYNPEAGLDAESDTSFTGAQVKAILRDKLLEEHIAEGQMLAHKRMAEAYNEVSDKGRQMRHMLAAGVAIFAIIVGCLLGLMLATNEMTKESHVNTSNAILSSVDTGAPVATAEVESQTTVLDMLKLPSDMYVRSYCYAWRGGFVEERRGDESARRWSSNDSGGWTRLDTHCGLHGPRACVCSQRQLL